MTASGVSGPVGTVSGACPTDNLACMDVPWCQWNEVCRHHAPAFIPPPVALDLEIDRILNMTDREITLACAEENRDLAAEAERFRRMLHRTAPTTAKVKPEC
jgi:hypothetical protein